MTSENLQDQIKVTCQIIQEILELLGDSWSENEDLRARLVELEKAALAASAREQQLAELQQVRSAGFPLSTFAQGRRAGRSQAEPKGVLIIDDSKLLQARFRGIIESLNYEVAGVAENGAQGIEQAQRLNPRLIILDYSMPEMNGLECLRELRKISSAAKVIICTSKINADISREFLKLGVTSMLMKPIQLDRFMREVRACMETAPLSH